MSDNHRRFVAIYKAIKKLYPVEPRGNLARHLTTLAMLISGIVASKRANLPAIASKIPTMTKVESRVKRFSRWIDNQRISFECYYLPLAWLVAEGSKGHFSEEDHITLIQQVKEIIPEDADVMFLGDGEFDGINLLAEVDSHGWKYVCHTAKDTILTQDSDSLTFEELHVWPGGRITLLSATITRKHYGPVQAIRGTYLSCLKSLYP